MANGTKYRWIPNGKSKPCDCGGTLVEYEVVPHRFTYWSRVRVCDNPRCEGMTTRSGLVGRVLQLLA